ncbi:Uncharacterised protein [Legionella wadsworthii]|uniref:Uncharacterized protein n=1 Tax=Legionella wadsworthii TaxID=28088 RepID=A0A378LXW0_9GAMM|nr:hypothetical protein [Legionella wadsworthii]STY31312.1 Uncharacterised protein [Legionella wadsworthii]
MLSKNNILNKKKCSAPSARTHLPAVKTIDLTHLVEQLMRTDLAIQTINKPAALAYDRVKKEITEAETELNQIKKRKRRTQKKNTLNETITKKRKWISDVQNIESKNFLSLWAAMFHGYRMDVVVNQNEHIKSQGLVVQSASEEFVKLLKMVLLQDIAIYGKTYSSADLKKYKEILSRFHDSIETIIIEDKSEITSERIKKLLSGIDLTIEHNCTGHAIYTQIYQEKDELVIIHCNRGNGLRANYNLVYRRTIAGLDLDKLKTALETITELEVETGNEENYKKFYDSYNKTLNDLGFNFRLGQHVKTQKIGNCVLANIKGLLKERLPYDVYKWCTQEMRGLSTVQHLIKPMLQSGKELKNKPINIDTDDNFFHLRQVINYIFDKSVEALINAHFGNVRKYESLKKAFKALGEYEQAINENKNLNSANRAAIKNYIHSKTDRYKKIFFNPEMRKPDIFYQVLWGEAEKAAASSADDLTQNDFFKYLINKAVSNPNFFTDIYHHYCRKDTENKCEVLQIILTQAMEFMTDDTILNDTEYLTACQDSLRKILLSECRKLDYESNLVTFLANTELTCVNPGIYLSAIAAMGDHKHSQEQAAALKLLLGNALKNNEFLDLFLRKKKPPVSIFFKQKKESFDFSDFFKSAAELIIEITVLPLTQEKLKLSVATLVPNTTERTEEKEKVRQLVELFCYKQLLDTKKINEKNIKNWNWLNVLANQCKQLQYCYPHVLKVADGVIGSLRQLEIANGRSEKNYGKTSNPAPSKVF